MSENITYFKQCLNKLGIQSVPTQPPSASNVQHHSVERARSNVPEVQQQPVVAQPLPQQSIYGQTSNAPVSYANNSSVYGNVAPSQSPYQSIYEQANNVPVSQTVQAPTIYQPPVVTEPLPQPSSSPVYAPAGIESVPVATAPVAPIAPVTASVAPSPDKSITKLSKQTDDILDDARYDGIHGDREANSSSNNTDHEDSSSCKGDIYDERGTAILHNMLKKLKLLEKEKEELRNKLIAVTSNGQIPQILECNTESLEEENSINDDIIAKFEITISSLRAENEILKEALEQVEEQEDQEDKVRELEKQLSDLVKKNHQLQNSLFKYQLESSNKAEKETASDSETDVLDDLINHNLSDIIPSNPDTL